MPRALPVPSPGQYLVGLLLHFGKYLSDTTTEGFSDGMFTLLQSTRLWPKRGWGLEAGILGLGMNGLSTRTPSAAISSDQRLPRY